ncbi:MAG: hypothetical protein ABIK92_21810 [Pseudomonadota bacterium]|uniref:Uncharacterized protein n=1 Tax=viral metagenome TaxID=1070528 RepID=A0A6M3L196_9ZZZZ
MPEGVSAPVGQPESAQSNVGAARGQAQSSDFYHGKSREEIIKDLEARSREYDQLQKNYAIVHDFASRVKFLFKHEGDNVVLDKDALKMTAQSQGWLDEWASEHKTGNGNPNETTIPGDFDMDDMTEQKALDERINRMLEERLEKKMAEKLAPFEKDRAESMISKMASEFSDFNERKTKILDWAQRHNYPLTNMDRLKSAYYASKGEEGKLMDVSQHQANIAQLEKVMQHSMHPHAKMVQSYNPEASVDELLGMSGPDGSGSNSDKTAALTALGLGGALPPPPS